MVSHTALPLLLLPFLFAAAADDLAPGPSPPGELNLTSILESGGQYSTLLRLLQATKISEQLTSQLKNTYDGLTFFAPNDNAFTKLKTGTLNGLTDQQKIQLLLYHVLPRYYSVTTFQTASNPLPTEASGPGGMYSVNVTTTTTSHLVNMSTGVVDVPISSTLSAKFPLAVYSRRRPRDRPVQRLGRRARGRRVVSRRATWQRSRQRRRRQKTATTQRLAEGVRGGRPLLLLLSSWPLLIWSALEKCMLAYYCPFVFLVFHSPFTKFSYYVLVLYVPL
ncbi:hypothetical protein PVAP13_6NG200800 [Panicum virgatum]|uniref:FAS1 domain-containing protein n=1 Tax=Panicum virgatum TaxID=38727 RepID=A0A8T0QY89_PANVG|nr:hypothetical protein PVAP13_6NG200800 [Panicum virgatum]